MQAGFRTPEDACRADDPTSAVSRMVRVDHSPDGEMAVVFLEYGSEPHVQLCTRRHGSWTTAGGGSGGGESWIATDPDETSQGRGVVTRWETRSARWNAAAPSGAGGPHQAESTIG